MVKPREAPIFSASTVTAPLILKVPMLAFTEPARLKPVQLPLRLEALPPFTCTAGPKCAALGATNVPPVSSTMRPVDGKPAPVILSKYNVAPSRTSKPAVPVMVMDCEPPPCTSMTPAPPALLVSVTRPEPTITTFGTYMVELLSKSNVVSAKVVSIVKALPAAPPILKSDGKRKVLAAVGAIVTLPKLEAAHARLTVTNPPDGYKRITPLLFTIWPDVVDPRSTVAPANCTTSSVAIVRVLRGASTNPLARVNVPGVPGTPSSKKQFPSESSTVIVLPAPVKFTVPLLVNTPASAKLPANVATAPTAIVKCPAVKLAPATRECWARTVALWPTALV